MALKPNALVTVVDARSFLGASATDDPVIERAINRASQLIESYCGRPLARAQYQSLRIRAPRGRELYPAAAPIDVTEAVTVTLDSEAQTVWRTEADGDPADADVVVARSVEHGVFQPDHLFRSSGWCPRSDQPYTVVLGYYGGFAITAVPADLYDAALLTLRRIYDDEKKSVGEVVAVNTPSGGVTLFDRWIPSRAREILDMGYRLVRVA
jgi:hypothetical protein